MQPIDPVNILPHCKEVQELLYLFVTGELEPEELDKVVRHLAECADCREALTEHAVLNKALHHTMPFVKSDLKMYRA